jgi:hypothetical protein
MLTLVPGFSSPGHRRQQMSKPFLRISHIDECCAKLMGATLLIAVLGLTWRVQSQEMEARAYSISPVGTNIVLLSYGRATGDLNFDTALPITDGKATIHSASAGYVRAISKRWDDTSLCVGKS